MIVVIIIVLCIITAGAVYMVTKRIDSTSMDKCNTDLSVCNTSAETHKQEYESNIEAAKLECDNELQKINTANKLAVDKLNADIITLKTDYENKIKNTSADLTASLTKECENKTKILVDKYDEQVAALKKSYNAIVLSYENKITNLKADYDAKVSSCETKYTDCSNSLTTCTSLKNACDKTASDCSAENMRINTLLTSITDEYNKYKIANPPVSTSSAPISNGNLVVKLTNRNNFYKIQSLANNYIGTNVIIVVNDTYVLTYNDKDGTNIISPESDSLPSNSNFFVKFTNDYGGGLNVFSNDRGNLYGVKRGSGGGALIHLPSWDKTAYSNVLKNDESRYATDSEQYYGKIDGDHISFFNTVSTTDKITLSFWSSQVLAGPLLSNNSKVLTNNTLNISMDVNIVCLGKYVSSQSTPTLTNNSSNTLEFTVDNGKIYRAGKMGQYGVNKNTLVFAISPSGDTNTYFNFTLSPTGELLIADNGYRCFYVNDKFVFSTTEKSGGVIFQLWK